MGRLEHLLWQKIFSLNSRKSTQQSNSCSTELSGRKLSRVFSMPTKNSTTRIIVFTLTSSSQEQLLDDFPPGKQMKIKFLGLEGELEGSTSNRYLEIPLLEAYLERHPDGCSLKLTIVRSSSE